MTDAILKRAQMLAQDRVVQLLDEVEGILDEISQMTAISRNLGEVRASGRNVMQMMLNDSRLRFLGKGK
jgi:hypothetical protein